MIEKGKITLLMVCMEACLRTPRHVRYENDRVREKGEEGEAAGRAGVRLKRVAYKYPPQYNIIHYLFGIKTLSAIYQNQNFLTFFLTIAKIKDLKYFMKTKLYEQGLL